MKINSSCRMCGSQKLSKFLDLGSQPLANAFLTKETLHKVLHGKPNPEGFYPLEAYVCDSCSLAQLVHVVDPEVLFRDYIYFSAGMPKVSAHWQGYADYVTKAFLADRIGQTSDLIVEIGSNDGILLSCFKNKGYKVLGVDPAENIAKLANERGVETLPRFWGFGVGGQILQKYGEASVILANNVFAHIDDHRDFMRGVDVLLAKNGVLVIEAPYLLDMFKNLAYDTIYHEHLSFLAVRPMVKFFQKFDFEIFDVQLVKAQGTSLRLFIGRKGWHEVSPSVSERVSEELALGLDKKKSYLKLAKRVQKSRDQLLDILIDLKLTGKRIAAYGAPAKGNTLLNYCKLRTDFLDFALEDLPSKQGLYTPGMHIPVVSREYAEAHPPDYYLLLAWNYRDAILEKEKEFMARGGKFIVPIGDDIKII